jgi:phosphomannomutase
VVIGYDGRHFSEVFAHEVASVLAGAGVRAYLFDKMVPTPLLAFALIELKAAAGVMVTASHNPPQYNGYKVFWDNGAQITPPHDTGIAAAIDAQGPAASIPIVAYREGLERGLILEIPPSLYERYFGTVTDLSLDSRGREGMKIVYTPLHGVGDPFTREALRRFGFDHVISVPEQRDPDPDFPTVNFPNPEEEGALDLALELARSERADLAIANDPDADRLSVAIPLGQGQGGFRQLSGNEIGILLADYLLRHDAKGGSHRLLVTTIVSTPLIGIMAEAEGVIFREVLTGFKWIATVAMEIEQDLGARTLIGFEEALGYMVGSAVRDKDGVSAAAVFAELAAVAAAEGRSVEDELERIARTYGLFVSRQISLVRKGLSGAEEIAAMMERLRSSPPAQIGAWKVSEVRDLLASTRNSHGVVTALDLPKSNVMAFDLAGGARVVARPSGTEPKLKLYFDLRHQVGEDDDFIDCRVVAEEQLDRLSEAVLEVLEVPS